MITLTLLDEVNCEFSGLNPTELSYIQGKLSFMKEGAFMTAAYQTGNSDGKECMFYDDGLCYIYHANIVLDCLENEFGYDLQNDVRFVDNREEVDMSSIHEVDDTFLLKETGRTLRDLQVDAINSVVREQKGIVAAATSSGKTMICLGISKVFDPILPSIVIVPTELLLNQTYEDYLKSDLNVSVIKSKTSKKKRKEIVENSRHIIITNKLFMNESDLFDGKQYVLMVDETHAFGETFAEHTRTTLRNCPIRIGLTASMPSPTKQKLKNQLIKCSLGGDEIIKIQLHELISKKHASEIKIEFVTTKHKSVENIAAQLESKNDWDIYKENVYMDNNDERASAIADYIKSLDKTNTLVLCRPSFGKKLAKLFDSEFIDETMSKKSRWDLLKKFDEEDINNHTVFASFGTVSTGISVNRIFRVITIDCGKSNTYAIQCLGRGVRLDGEINKVEAIDIGCNLKYGKKHKKERIAIYKKMKLPYTMGDDIFID